MSSVDNPRQAVSEADVLVSSAIEEIMSGFSDHRQRLEASWQKGAQVTTDELRDVSGATIRSSNAASPSERSAWAQALKSGHARAPPLRRSAPCPRRGRADGRVVCPPYDVITDKQRQVLLDRSPHNIVRVELPE